MVNNISSLEKVVDFLSFFISRVFEFVSSSSSPSAWGFSLEFSLRSIFGQYIECIERHLLRNVFVLSLFLLLGKNFCRKRLLDGLPSGAASSILTTKSEIKIKLINRSK